MTAPGPARPETPIAGLVELALSAPTFQQLIESAAARPDELSLVGPASARLFVASALAQQGSLLVVTATGREADDLAVELRGVFGTAVAVFPSWETLPHERLSPGVDTVGTRLMVLRRLAYPDDARLGPPLRVVVTAARSLLQPMAPRLGHQEPVTLRVGQEIGFEDVIARLVELAYTRVDMVGRRGEFAVRGGILDIFAPTAEHPVRVEFWGDEVTEMRMFSVADQRSIPEIEVETLVAVACRELLLTADVRARAAELVAQQAAGRPTGEAAISGSVSDMLAKLAEGIPVDGMEALLPVLKPDDHALLVEQLAEGTPVLLCDPEKVRTRAADLIKTGREFLEASWSVAAMGTDAPVDVEQLGGSGFAELDDVQAAAHRSGHPWWTLSQLSDESAVELDVKAAPSARGHQQDIEGIFAMLRAHVLTGGYGVIVAPGTGTAHRVVERLAESDTPAAMLDAGAAPKSGVVGVLKGPLHGGVVIPGANLVVITEADLTGSRATSVEGKRLAAKRRNTVDPLALNAGDLVVHDQHGIGRFVEMVERTVGGARREYLVLEYASSKKGSGTQKSTDKLYVPMDSLDQLSRYVGGQAPALSRLGGSDWVNTKTKARRAVREIAGELVSLYAKRQASAGHAFGPDTPWQAEMEDAFGFTETVDQLTAITEVKSDMEKPIPMDRVICGDVGYGKTEIAVRAAFKAVQDGKQVAVLVPTTLLADQHLQTFADRMAGFPVIVKGLSRFTDTTESRAVIDGLADGSVDIVIGTHRLLQTGVRWKDLGLVVVDEEQRFGVEHKEHIKSLRTHVDVLTMSATPIPRTLEMSLAGIREMSTILTPPEERYPVLTYVGPQEEKQIAAALRRELLRDGQAFYVHNRVSSIDRTAARVRELVPEARVVVAHGQMPEDLLERTVEGFWNREHDILVCTTIVETGLDISNANTLIVERADTFGLSQLHQLRGRVGRSRERGYAYFLYPPEVPLTETAYDRLATIAQNNELGAGMAVALKDLEIRGAGNVLGVEQSGHVAGVGFDLYVRLVGEAVEAYKAAADGETVTTAEEPKDVRIDLPVDAHLPPDYIGSDRLRLEAYRRLAAAASDREVGAVVEELVDRYGALPEPAQRLVAVARLRLICRSAGVTEVSAPSAATVRLSPITLPDSAQVRLKRMYPAANYRATTSTVQVPIPRAGGASGGLGAPRIRDVELLQLVANLVTALQGKPHQDVGITSSSPDGDKDSQPAAMSTEERQAR
jgi:transcription-repair coupling factor (superfamily II helicase)